MPNRPKHLVALAALTTLAALAGCATSATLPAPLPLHELSRSTLSAVDASRRQVVRDATTWTRVWHEIQDSSGTPPAVDFDGQMVLVACLGERRVGGYSVQIVSAGISNSKGDADALVVTVQEGSPTPDMLQPQMLTQPCASARVARTDLPIHWINLD